MTLTELYDELNRHDWYYNFSDDHRVWKAGQSNQARLTAISKDIPGGEELMDAFSKHHFSGAPWSTPEAPKPVRPE